MTGSPHGLDDEQQKLWEDLLTVVMALPALLDRQLQRDEGISNFEYSVMARLAMAEMHTMRLSDLAAQCNSSLPRLSKLMVRFEQQGWATRAPCSNNARYTVATLTDAGLQKVKDSTPAHVEQVRQLVFDPLSAAQQRHLGAAIARIAALARERLDGR